MRSVLSCRTSDYGRPEAQLGQALAAGAFSRCASSRCTRASSRSISALRASSSPSDAPASQKSAVNISERPRTLELPAPTARTGGGSRLAADRAAGARGRRDGARLSMVSGG